MDGHELSPATGDDALAELMFGFDVERTLHDCSDDLVLKDEHLDAVEHEDKDDQNRQVLDPGALDQLPEAWCISDLGQGSHYSKR